MTIALIAAGVAACGLGTAGAADYGDTTHSGGDYGHSGSKMDEIATHKYSKYEYQGDNPPGGGDDRDQNRRQQNPSYATASRK